MIIYSDRLKLREFNADDFELFCSVYSNEHIMEYAWYDHMQDYSELLQAFTEVLENNKEIKKRKEYEFAVFSKFDNSFIGTGLIIISYRYDMPLNAEIGYFILPEFWEKGFATELAKVLIEYCFNKLNIHRVIASCNANNLSSEKVMKKAGMNKEGEFKKARYKNGKWYDEYQYSILRDD